MEIFEKNLGYVQQQNPLLAFQLRLGGYQASQAFERDLAIDDSQLGDTEVIYIYGLGGYRKLKKWLRENSMRRLVLMEDDLSAFLTFLEQVETEAVLTDPQVKIASLSDPIEENLKKVIWPFLFRPHKFFALGASDSQREEKTSYVSSLFSELQMGAEMSMCLYRDFGARQIQNILQNLSRSEYVLKGESLKGCFKNVPAVICGAGPSLEKNLEVLKTFNDRALLFAGGSALGPLSQSNIPIHFGGGIDPNPPKQRFLRQNYFELPFCYQNQLASEIFSNLQAERICFGESGGFPLEKWILEECNISLPSLDAGFTVTTFLTRIAQMLGCSPIIFVGIDGCNDRGKTYSDGVEQPEEASTRKDSLLTQDQLGRMVSTRTDFLLARSWIEAFAAQHPETQFLNASEKGLVYEGIQRIALKDVNLDKRFDGRGLVHRALEAAEKIQIDSVEVLKLIRRIQKSCKSCLTFSEKILKSQANYSLEETLLEEEVFYQMVLLPLWDVWHHFLQTEEIISQMKSPEIEKKIQRALFFSQVCKRYLEEVFG